MTVRPLKIYLDNPIEIEGVKIGLTVQGLHYMRDHYEGILTRALNEQLGDNERKHLRKIIDDYTFHIALYERNQPATSGPDTKST